MRCCIVRSACIATVLAVAGACYDKPTCLDLGLPCPGDDAAAGHDDGGVGGTMVSSTKSSQEGGTEVPGSGGVGGAGGRSAMGGASPSGGATGAGGTPWLDAGADVTARDGAPDAALDAADGADSGVPGCDSRTAPYSEACLQYGVFVSPVGSDARTGEKTQPFATIAKALAVARGNRRTIYVCSRMSAGDAAAGETHDRGPDASLADGGIDADFTEAITIDAAAENVTLVGGVDCMTWKQLPSDRRTRVKTGAGVIPLRIANAQGNVGVTIEGFEFETHDAKSDEERNSVAAFVSNSKNVRLKRVTLTAGAGKNGSDAQTKTNFPAQLAVVGDALGQAGGQECLRTCLDGTFSKGGKGGATDGTVATGGMNGDPLLPNSTVGDGLGGSPSQSCTLGVGHDGANAPSAAGGNGASSYGTLSQDGWKPSDGENGANGSPGQGGGGGAARNFQGDSGGGSGGGCGGCGGGGGKGGLGGGSSFAFLSWEATEVVLENCTFSASTAGDGGAGSEGEPGERGVSAGKSAPPGCNGGSGGTGGTGGAGGGGAGGLSVGIAYVGQAPYETAAIIHIPSSVAIGGPAGRNDPAASPAAKEGIPGASLQRLALDRSRDAGMP